MRTAMFAKASILLATLLTLHAETRADKVDDFKEAVRQVGCQSIPYTDLRNNCRDQQSYVHPWCDGGHGPTSCDVRVTRDLRTRLVQEQTALASLQERRRDLDDKRSRATDDAARATLTAQIDVIDKEIEASRKRIEVIEREVVNRKYLVETTMSTINKCIDYRRAVMNVYAYALEKVRTETEADIKPLAEVLRAKYSEEISGHEKQITARFDALRICKDEVP